MDIHELNPKKTIWTLLFFGIVIIIGFLTMRKPLLTYSKSISQSIEMTKDTSNNYFYPYQLVSVINKKNKNVILIDLRNKYDFGRGHIPGAKSIPSFDLAKNDNLKLLEAYEKNNLTVVLYADNQLDANGPWFFFRQVGFNNIRILLGGYDYYAAHKDNLNATQSSDAYLKGLARYDFAKVAKSTVNDENNAQSNKVKPVVFKRRKKVNVAAGGC